MNNQLNQFNQPNISTEPQQSQPSLQPEIPKKPGLPTWVIVLIAVLSIAIIGIGGYAAYQYYFISDEPVVCTKDAKVCPDGSTVGRVLPDCEFAKCTEDDKLTCIDNLDCPSQMKCENKICVDVGCVEEGDFIPGAISPEYREHMATECCAGLTNIEYKGNYDEECNVVGLAGGPAGACTKCGNGQCEENMSETKCNCPEDCQKETDSSFQP